MSQLDVIDLDEIFIINSMWKNDFFNSWMKVGVALFRKSWENQKFKKCKKKQKKEIYRIWWFLVFCTVTFTIF